MENKMKRMEQKMGKEREKGNMTTSRMSRRWRRKRQRRGRRRKRKTKTKLQKKKKKE